MAADDLKLTISFEGSAPGLPDERLSIGAFGDALQKLLRAYRRIASGLIRDALGKPGYGEKGGSYANEAKALDLELAQLTHNSPLSLDFVCTVHDPGPQMPLFHSGLLEKAGVILLESIEAEGKQELRHARVREFLQALPVGITRQTYKLRRGSKPLQEVVLQDVSIAQPPAEMSSLVAFDGDVVGVGFDPGTTEVKLKHHGTTNTFPAAEGQVESALKLRANAVRALALRGKRQRLLRLGAAGEKTEPRSFDEIVKSIDEKWGPLLERLAK